MSNESQHLLVTSTTRRLLWAGAGLVGLGGAMCLFGGSLVAAALADATRRWVRQLDESPTELARRRSSQAKSAALAAADAWQHGRPEASAQL